MVKVWELVEGRRPPDRGSYGGSSARAEEYDLVILDAPATGHATAMLRSPRTLLDDRPRSPKPARPAG